MPRDRRVDLFGRAFDVENLTKSYGPTSAPGTEFFVALGSTERGFESTRKPNAGEVFVRAVDRRPDGGFASTTYQVACGQVGQFPTGSGAAEPLHRAESHGSGRDRPSPRGDGVLVPGSQPELPRGGELRRFERRHGACCFGLPVAGGHPMGFRNGSPRVPISVLASCLFALATAADGREARALCGHGPPWENSLQGHQVGDRNLEIQTSGRDCSCFLLYGSPGYCAVYNP
jgi:hypothetical protein